MKKLFTSVAVMSALALSGCASTGTGMSTNPNNTVNAATDVGMNIFKTAVDTQCRNEVEKQKAWKLASVAMTSEQEESAKTNVCSCVSEQAPQQVSIVDLTNAAVDSSFRNQLVGRVVTKSLQSCYGRLTSTTPNS